MLELAPPVIGGRVMSRQGCRTLPRYQAAELRPQDIARCAQLEGHVYRVHNGMDIGAPDDTPIVMPYPARIRRAYQLGGFYDPAVDVGSGGYGRTIVLELFPGCLMVCAHCSWTRSDVGAVVQLGEQVASVGRTEGSAADPTATTDGPHLHLEFVRRWPLRSDQIDERYDVAGTLANLGIVESGGRYVWASSAGAPGWPGGTPRAEGPFPAEGIAPGGAVLLSSSAPPPGEPDSRSGHPGALGLALAAWLLWRARGRHAR